MLCFKWEKSQLFMPSNSQIKPFRKKYGGVRLDSSEHNESQERQGQFFSKCIQAVLHTLKAAQIAAFKISETNHRLMSAITITCIPVQLCKREKRWAVPLIELTVEERFQSLTVAVCTVKKKGKSLSSFLTFVQSASWDTPQTEV